MRLVHPNFVQFGIFATAYLLFKMNIERSTITCPGYPISNTQQFGLVCSLLSTLFKIYPVHMYT
jgi:hypothetical protein